MPTSKHVKFRRSIGVFYGGRCESIHARVHLCNNTSFEVSCKAYELPRTSIDLNLDQIFIQIHEVGTKLDLN